ncbi:ABC transporter substrate-binding protein, partial [Rhizobium leguminosarum]|uniref:ABC transporter substrate-binding protein n=1 Tax=Rhizobium leguminosarum TaxID=384 RepID=UPI003F9493BB
PHVVATMAQVCERSVRFTFNDTAARETPLTFGLFPVLPKHAIDPATFDRSSLTPPFGSGPYKVKTVKPGESITYESDPNYWGKDIPAKGGTDKYD